ALDAMIADRYGINPAETRDFEHVLCGLNIEAESRGQDVEVHQLAHYDVHTGHLYISQFGGFVYRLNGETIEQVPNGTDGVFFWDDPTWHPYKVVAAASSGLF